MKTKLETEQDFICDIQAPCFQMLLADEVELVSGSKTDCLNEKDILVLNHNGLLEISKKG